MAKDWNKRMIELHRKLESDVPLWEDIFKVTKGNYEPPSEEERKRYIWVLSQDPCIEDAADRANQSHIFLGTSGTDGEGFMYYNPVTQLQEMKKEKATTQTLRMSTRINPSHYMIPNYSLSEGIGGLYVSNSMQYIKFVKGGENRQIGTTSENVISLLISHLTELNDGEFKNKETECAIEHLLQARLWLHERKLERESRDVLGKQIK